MTAASSQVLSSRAPMPLERPYGMGASPAETGHVWMPNGNAYRGPKTSGTDLSLALLQGYCILCSESIMRETEQRCCMHASLSDRADAP